MEKKIIIQGKNNIDRLTEKNREKIKRKVVLETNAWKKVESIDVENVERHIDWVQKLKDDEEFPERKALERDLKNKLNSYKHQDIEKKMYNPDRFMTMSCLIDLLISSKLKCYYCKEYMYILYENVRESKQWTLDRINNYLGHLCDNCFIACLRCNIQRKRMNDEKFKFSKQVKVQKLNNEYQEDDENLDVDRNENMNICDEYTDENEIKSIKFT